MLEMNDRERQLAHSCPLTVVTEADIDSDAANYWLPTLVQEAFGYNPFLYDVLSFTDLARIDPVRKPERWKVFVTDMGTATGLHHVEDVLILSKSWCSARRIADALKQEPGLEMLHITANGNYRAMASHPFRAILTCMDFRLHRGRGSLLGKLLRQSLGSRAAACSRQLALPRS